MYYSTRKRAAHAYSCIMQVSCLLSMHLTFQNTERLATVILNNSVSVTAACRRQFAGHHLVSRLQARDVDCVE
jgi:hypothetical protein